MDQVTLPRATVEQVLGALEGGGESWRLIGPAIDALRAALEQEPLTIERLRDALVASRIIPPAAVEDPDGYDDGVTLFRIDALHSRLMQTTPPTTTTQPEPK
jgi:hypothetical protein